MVTWRYSILQNANIHEIVILNYQLQKLIRFTYLYDTQTYKIKDNTADRSILQ
jgi:hypothetical protein